MGWGVESTLILWASSSLSDLADARIESSLQQLHHVQPR